MSEASAPRLSAEAETVLRLMLDGWRLIGSPDDFGRDFRLERPGHDWVNVRRRVFDELIDGRRIRARPARPEGATEFEISN